MEVVDAQSDVYCWFYEQEESNVINRYDTQLTTYYCYTAYFCSTTTKH